MSGSGNNSYYNTSDGTSDNCNAPFDIPLNTRVGVITINGIISFLGLFGNIFVCMVIIKGRKMYTVANIFLMNLAFADMLVLLITYPLYVVEQFGTWPFGELLCKIIPPFTDAFPGSSLGCMTVISIHRYRMIVHAMQTQLSFFQARLIIAAIWIIALLSISGPMFPLMQYYDFTVNNETHVECHANFYKFSNVTDLMSTNRLPPYLVTYQSLTVTVWYFLPLLIILFTFVRIKFFLRKTMKFEWLNGSTTIGMKDKILGIKRTLRMLSPVVIVFAIMMLPQCTLRLVHVIFPTFLPCFTYFHVFFQFAASTAIANSAVNPFIYYIMSREFRIEFRKQFWLLKKYLRLANEGDTYTIQEEEGGKRYIRRMQSFAISVSRKTDDTRFSRFRNRSRSDTESTANTLNGDYQILGSTPPSPSPMPNFDEMFRSYSSGEYKVRGNGCLISRPLTTVGEDEGSVESENEDGGMNHEDVYEDVASNDSIGCNESSKSIGYDGSNASIVNNKRVTFVDNDEEEESYHEIQYSYPLDALLSQIENILN